MSLRVYWRVLVYIACVLVCIACVMVCIGVYCVCNGVYWHLLVHCLFSSLLWVMRRHYKS